MESAININNNYEKYCSQNNLVSNLQINITGKCNANCKFCFQDGSIFDELNYSKVIEVVEEAKLMGTYAVNIAGGEPFAYKNIHDVIRYIRSKGLEVTLVTNAHLLEDKDIDFLTEYAITNVGVSFHSVECHTYTQIFQVDEKYYYKALENIKKMLSRGLNVSIACTITSSNFHETANILEFFLKLGIKKDCIAFNNLIEGKRQLSDLEINENDQLTANAGRVNLEDNQNRLCSAGRSALVINYNGDVQICSFLDFAIGNIYKNSLSNIWASSPILKLYKSIEEKHFSPCDKCNKSPKCKICIAKNINMTGNALNIPPSYCQAAKKYTREV